MTEATDLKVPAVPKPSRADAAHTAGRVLAGSIPFVGGPATELFNFLITPPIERRRDEWREQMGQALQSAIDAGSIQIEELVKDEAFASAVIQASTVAMRSHQEMKREALKNAVLNSAMPSAPDESLQQIFINWIDELTVDHIRYLLFFRDPGGWFDKHNLRKPQFVIAGSVGQLLELALPELHRQADLTELISADLKARKVFGGGENTVLSASGAWMKRTTELGDRFLDFISEPKIS